MAARRVLLSGLGLLALMVGGAALAWACSMQADLKLMGAGGSGLAYPGTTVRLEAGTPRGWPPGTPVTVTASWNGGQTVASGTGPEFTATVTVPNVPDGVYTFKATGVESAGPRVGSASLRVGEPGVSPAAAGDAGSTGGSTSGAGSGAGTPAAGSASGSTGGGEGVVSGRDSQSASGAARGQVRSRARGDAPAPGVGAAKRDPGVTTAASGQPVFADSVGANTPRGATPGKRGSAARSAKAAPSRSTASGDLWSGFAPGKAPSASLGGSVGPAGGPGSALTLGLALGAIGLLALTAGVGAAGLRRRHRRAPTAADPRD